MGKIRKDLIFVFSESKKEKRKSEAKRVFEGIMAEHVSKLAVGMNLQIQEA